MPVNLDSAHAKASRFRTLHRAGYIDLLEASGNSHPAYLPAGEEIAAGGKQAPKTDRNQALRE